jgi:hypothetical protein
VRVYLPEEELDTPVVLCSELPTNECTSMTKAAEQLPEDHPLRGGRPATITGTEEGRSF